jgi:hypothetical protein
MTDVRLRDAERRALSGSVEDQARALTERLRAGTLTRERLELAAYVGHEAAATAAGWTGHHVLDRGPHSMVKASDFFASQGGLTQEWGRSWRQVFAAGLEEARAQAALSSWLSGLSRWSDIGPAPGWVLVRAAVAAARVAHKAAKRAASGPGGQSMSALAAREALRASLRSAIAAVEAAEKWLACPCEEHWTARHVAYVEASHLAWLPPPGQDAERHRDAIRHAARLAGESPVLNAIRSSLIEWSLGGEK